MIFEAGQRIRCLLRTNTLVEGIIVEWDPDELVLQSVNDASILVVHHPNQDIVMTKILTQESDDRDSGDTVKIVSQDVEKAADLEEAVRSLVANGDNIEEEIDLRTKSIVELKADLDKQEKKIITDKLKSHTIDPNRRVKYTNLFFKKSK